MHTGITQTAPGGIGCTRESHRRAPGGIGCTRELHRRPPAGLVAHGNHTDEPPAGLVAHGNYKEGDRGDWLHTGCSFVLRNFCGPCSKIRPNGRQLENLFWETKKRTIFHFQALNSTKFVSNLQVIIKPFTAFPEVFISHALTQCTKTFRHLVQMKAGNMKLSKSM